MNKINYFIITLSLLIVYNLKADSSLPKDHFRVELAESVTKSCQIVMSDTIVLALGGANTRLGDEVCIPVYASNFNNIISFQMQFGFEPQYLQFSHIIGHPSFKSLSTSNFEIDQGKLRTLWIEDALTPVTIDSVPIMEICFQVVGASDVPTFVKILDNEDYPLEIVNDDIDAQPLPVISHSGLINISNTLDCGLLPICKENQEYIFVPDMILHKEDIIEQYDLFLACYGYLDEEVKIINMSDPNAIPSDSLLMTCDNVYAETTIGVSILNDSVSLVICHASITFNIPDNLENCTNVVRSCIDPITCQAAATITVTELQTVVDYGLFVPNSNQSCGLNIFSSYESIATIPDEYPNGFVIDCSDYAPELPIRLGIDADLNGYTIVVLEWCSPTLVINGHEDVCQDGNIDSTEVPIRIRGGASVVTLNDIELVQKGPELFVARMDALQPTDNFIQVNRGGTPSIENISTLDAVFMYKNLVDEDGRPVAGISSDVDLSGSLTTKDIREHRLNILGIEYSATLGTNFLIEKEYDFSDFSYLEFQNDFGSFKFDKAYIEEHGGLEFEVFNYGNVSDAESDFHKNYSAEGEIKIEILNKQVKKGEIYELPLTFTNQTEEPVIAMDISLDVSMLDMVSVDYSYEGSTLMHNLLDNELRISFFSPKQVSNFNMDIKFIAKTDGKISDLLNINEKAINESVTESLSVSRPLLEYLPIKEDTDQISVYPNPTTESVNVNIPDDKLGASIHLYNSLGQVITTTIADQNIMNINLANRNLKGLIHVVINDGDESASYSIIAQ